MTAEQKKKSKEFLSRLHEKYYGKKTNKVTKVAKMPTEPSGNKPSRNEIMLQAKAKGVKNYRVINKQELIEILKEDTSKERITEIVAGAVARWKAGWGSKKGQV